MGWEGWEGGGGEKPQHPLCCRVQCVLVEGSRSLFGRGQLFYKLLIVTMNLTWGIQVRKTTIYMTEGTEDDERMKENQCFQVDVFCAYVFLCDSAINGDIVGHFFLFGFYKKILISFRANSKQSWS